MQKYFDLLEKFIYICFNVKLKRIIMTLQRIAFISIMALGVICLAASVAYGDIRLIVLAAVVVCLIRGCKSVF